MNSFVPIRASILRKFIVLATAIFVALHIFVALTEVEKGLRATFPGVLLVNGTSQSERELTQQDAVMALWSRTDFEMEKLCKSAPLEWQTSCHKPSRNLVTNYRIIQLNAFQMKKRGTMDLVFGWLKARSADYAGLLELNEFTDTEFASVALSYGYNHAAFLKTDTGFHLGFISRNDPVLSVRRHVDGFHHGALKLKMESGRSFVVVHLSPRDPEVRI